MTKQDFLLRIKDELSVIQTEYMKKLMSTKDKAQHTELIKEVINKVTVIIKTTDQSRKVLGIPGVMEFPNGYKLYFETEQDITLEHLTVELGIRSRKDKKGIIHVV